MAARDLLIIRVATLKHSNKPSIHFLSNYILEKTEEIKEEIPVTGETICLVCFLFIVLVEQITNPSTFRSNTMEQMLKKFL